MSKEMYRYIWFLTIILKKKGYSEEEIRFKMSKLVSPYFELNDVDLNDSIFLEKKSKVTVEVNPFLRFTGIFELLLDPNFEENTEIKQVLFNVFMHFNNFIDLQNGLNKKIILSKKIIKEVEEGYYGKEEKELFKEFDEEEKLILAENIQEVYIFSENIESFKKIVRKIFSDSIIYDNIYSETKLVIYINYKKSEKNKRKMKFIKNIFLPLDIDMKIFWETHFGIIGVEETMRLGEIAIY